MENQPKKCEETEGNRMNWSHRTMKQMGPMRCIFHWEIIQQHMNALFDATLSFKINNLSFKTAFYVRKGQMWVLSKTEKPSWTSPPHRIVAGSWFSSNPSDWGRDGNTKLDLSCTQRSSGVCMLPFWFHRGSMQAPKACFDLGLRKLSVLASNKGE